MSHGVLVNLCTTLDDVLRTSNDILHQMVRYVELYAM